MTDLSESSSRMASYIEFLTKDFFIHIKDAGMSMESTDLEPNDNIPDHTYWWGQFEYTKKRLININQVLTEFYESLKVIWSGSDAAEPQGLLKIKEESGKAKLQKDKCFSELDLVALRTAAESESAKHNILTEQQASSLNFIFGEFAYNASAVNGVILANPVGTGKSAIVIRCFAAFALANPYVICKMLILCPKNVIGSWGTQLAEWLNMKKRIGFCVLTNKIMKEKCVMLIRQWFWRGGVIVLSYGKFDSFRRQEFSTNRMSNSPSIYDILLHGATIMALDEGHKLSNQTTKIYNCVKQVSTQRKILISGTVSQLSKLLAVTPLLITDGFALVPLLKHRMSRSKVRESEHKSHGTLEMQTYLEKIFHSKQQLQQQLPDQEIWILNLKMSNIQDILYTNFLDWVFSDGNCQWQHENTIVEKDAILSRIAMHPDLIYNEYVKNSKYSEWCASAFDTYTPGLIENGVKFQALLKILKITDFDENIIVYSNYLTTLDFIEDHLREEGYKNILRVDGQTSSERRESTYKKMNEQRRREILLMTSKSAGEGVSLSSVKVSVLVDMNWNPSIDQQCIGRIRRLGAGNSSIIYRLRAVNSLDDYKVTLQNKKNGTRIDKCATEAVNKEHLFKNACDFLQNRNKIAERYLSQSIIEYPGHIQQLYSEMNCHFMEPNIAFPQSIE